MKLKSKYYMNKLFTDYLPYLLLFIIALSYSFTAKLGIIDDLYFIKEFNQVNNSIIAFMIMRFNTWSSRIFIESLLVFFTHQHLMWRIVNSVTYFGTGIVLIKLVNDKSNALKWFVVLLLSVYPYTDMASAGWIATTLNYSWPLFFGLIALIPLRIYHDQEKINPYVMPIFLFFTLFAANVEQMAGILFLIYTYFLVRDALQHRFRALIWIQYGIVILNLVLIFISPGNYIRKTLEIGTWFPEYSSISLIRIIEMGFSSALYPLIFSANSIYLVFSVILFLYANINKKSDFHIIISLVPILLIFIFNVFNRSINMYFPIVEHIKLSLTKFGTGASFTQFVSVVPDLILVAIIISILYSLFKSAADRKRFYFFISILVLGFISRFVIAFSPTIWASVERTYIFFYFSIILVSMFMFKEISKTYKNLDGNQSYKALLFLAILLSFLNNLYLITYRF